MLSCDVPVGYKCTFDNVLTNDQMLTLGLGIIGLICLTIVIIAFLVYLDGKGKRDG